ncbi:hypothetical protein DX914_02525 [Lysobacter silvisoli]|uniref:Uncharacterized protein n=1 Tax=Lysobacter silvisoli TaxID=2293254 RepID=A0A371K2E9_9GAMM|nr:hypothetical protein DX914_02525 [Lysobacter silvisoli]
MQAVLEFGELAGGVVAVVQRQAAGGGVVDGVGAVVQVVAAGQARPAQPVTALKDAGYLFN